MDQTISQSSGDCAHFNFGVSRLASFLLPRISILVLPVQTGLDFLVIVFPVGTFANDLPSFIERVSSEAFRNSSFLQQRVSMAMVLCFFKS